MQERIIKQAINLAAAANLYLRDLKSKMLSIGRSPRLSVKKMFVAFPRGFNRTSQAQQHAAAMLVVSRSLRYAFLAEANPSSWRNIFSKVGNGRFPPIG
jgi:hypothetical protein